MAIASGVLLAFAETWINWGQWQWWPWWLVDYVAALLLISGGFNTLSGPEWGKRLLTGGWAFTLGMAWMSLAGNISGGADPARDARVGGLYLTLIGVGMAWSLVGFLLALFAGMPKRVP